MNDPLTGIGAVAQRRGEGSLALAQAWRHALQRLISTGITPEQAERLAEHCATPPMAMRLANALEEGQADYQRLLAAVDGSAYALMDWVGALDVLQQWLERHPRRTHMQHKLGYISCCSESEPGRPLGEVLTLMLDAYGYDGLDESH